MSLADFRFLRKLGATGTWEGLRPPPATIRAIYHDLRWHAALYREDGLPLRLRVAFLGLRVVQRVAYNAGWRDGGAK